MELLILGYIRQFENKCCFHIPCDIQRLILLYYPKMRNAFGEIINDYDIQVSYDALSELSKDKTVTMEQFIRWVNEYLQLQWDDSRIKSVWNTLDTHKRKYITFKEFENGLKSHNSDVMLFYTALMRRNDVDPTKTNASDWTLLTGTDRIRRMRVFAPRYLRQFTRKKNKKLHEFQKFLVKWKKLSIDFLCDDYWRPVKELNKNYGPIVGNLWRKLCVITATIAIDCWSKPQYSIISYELFIIMARTCHHQNFIAYLSYKHMLYIFIINYNKYDIYNHKHQGPIAWCESAMVATIKHAIRPNISLKIVNEMTDLLLIELGVIELQQQEHRDKYPSNFKMPDHWNECCKAKFVYGLCIAIDCTENVKPIKDIQESEGGGQTLIKKLGSICMHTFKANEINTLQLVILETYKLLCRIAEMNKNIHNNVLKQIHSEQRIKYYHNYGKECIVRFTFIQPIYPMPPTYPTALAPTYLAPAYQMVPNMNLLCKSRIMDCLTFDKLQNPFEFPVTIEDIMSAFTYADLNQDNIISFDDFAQSLNNCGVVTNDEELKEMWLVFNPNTTSKGVNLETFEQKLREYPPELHHWLSRIVSCNHLARQPFKTDPNGEIIQKVLADRRKHIWREGIDALYAFTRLFARTNDSKKEFQNKFELYLPSILYHLSDLHPLIVRATCISLTKIMIYKNNHITKYAVTIMNILTENFQNNDKIVYESSFGCWANLVRHVPDNKRFEALQFVLKLVNSSAENVRCMGWRIAVVTFERILGLRKARPNSWWIIAENILKVGTKEKSKLVQRHAILLLFVFRNSVQKYYHYIEKYINFFPIPDDIDKIKEECFRQIQQKMDEYAEEAIARDGYISVYSVVSIEDFPHMEEKTKECYGDSEQFMLLRQQYLAQQRQQNQKKTKT